MNNFRDTDRILIIGGTGFIGKHLVKRCLKDTPHVTSLRLTEKAHPDMDPPALLHADLNDRNELHACLGGKAYDYIFNLGGYIDHTPYFKGGRANIESHLTGLMNLLDTIDTGALRSFVQIGSSDEYGNAPAPQREEVREGPISPYSFAKTAASHLIQTLSRTEGFPGAVLRLFLVYGPGQDDRRFLPQIIKGCLNDKEFKTSEGGQLRDFCYIDDAVDAMALAALTPEAGGHIINIASGVPVSIREMIEKTVNIIGSGKPLWGSHPYREGENMELYADIALAKKLLKWSPATNLEEGLKRTIEYLKTDEETK